MNTHQTLLFCVLAILAGHPQAGTWQAGTRAAEATLEVPPGKIPGQRPDTMMTRYWLRQADEALRTRQAEYEARKTPRKSRRTRAAAAEVPRGHRRPAGADPAGRPSHRHGAARRLSRGEDRLREPAASTTSPPCCSCPTARASSRPIPACWCPAATPRRPRATTSTSRWAPRWPLPAWRRWWSIRSTRASGGSTSARAAGRSLGRRRPFHIGIGRTLLGRKRPASRSGTTCGRSTTSNRGRRWIRSGSAAPATAAAARRPAT